MILQPVYTTVRDAGLCTAVRFTLALYYGPKTVHRSVILQCPAPETMPRFRQVSLPKTPAEMDRPFNHSNRSVQPEITRRR